MSFLTNNNDDTKDGKFTKALKHNIEPIIENVLYITGILIILAGSIDSIRRGIIRIQEKEKSIDEILTNVRVELSETLTLALTFILGAEIVKTFRVPNLYQLIKVSILVLLRQLITHFLDTDVEKLRRKYAEEVPQKDEKVIDTPDIPCPSGHNCRSCVVGKPSLGNCTHGGIAGCCDPMPNPEDTNVKNNKTYL